MRARPLAFLAFAVAMAALCARLGVWQLSRLRERQARNALVAARIERAEVPLGDLPADSAARRFRRVVVTGVYDYAGEVVYAGRSRNGSPGAHLVTPLRVAGRDTAVLVNRGWVYAPDGARVDRARWREREGDTVTIRGFVDHLATGLQGPARLTGHEGRAFRRLDPGEVATVVGAPVTPYQVVVRGDTAGTGASRIPVRLEPPPLDEGSHRSYAVQWFSFAIISLAGVAVVLRGKK